MAKPAFATEQAKAWLRRQLADGLAHHALDLIAEGEQIGIARRTLQLASEEMVHAGEMTRHMEYKPTRRWLWQAVRVLSAK